MSARPCFYYLPAVHHENAVRNVPDDAEVMRDEEKRKPELALQVLEKIQHRRADREVEGAHRLVADQQIRLRRDRPRDADALALPARELVRILVERRGVKANQCKQPTCVFRLTSNVLLREDFRRETEDASKLLELVGLDASALDKYPHEFSGGQRQRICIARAIATKPELLICDEAVSALDLSIRAQVLDLLEDLKRKLGLSLLFITHDLGVVRHIADRILVMNRGRIIEEGPCGQVLKAPREEYTRYLISSVPKIGKPLT